jgi:hypothetical protein
MPSHFRAARWHGVRIGSEPRANYCVASSGQAASRGSLGFQGQARNRIFGGRKCPTSGMTNHWPGQESSGPIHLGRLDGRGRPSPHESLHPRTTDSGCSHMSRCAPPRGKPLPLESWHGLSHRGRGQHCGDLPRCNWESLPRLRFVGRTARSLAIAYPGRDVLDCVWSWLRPLGLGLFFGLTTGVASGVTIAIELNRASRGLDHYSWWWEGLFSAIRGIAFGACLYRNLGLEFAAAFAVLLTAGQLFAYSRGMRPALDCAATGRPRLTRRHAWGILLRTLGYTATALLCSALVQHVDHVWLFALRIGLVIGIVTGVGVAIVPMIEYYAQPAGATAWSAWHSAHPMRVCVAVVPVLGGPAGCESDVE